MVNRLSHLAPECNGTPATEAKPTPPAGRFLTLREVLVRNQATAKRMDRDARKIVAAARKLHAMIADFVEEYDECSVYKTFLEDGWMLPDPAADILDPAVQDEYRRNRELTNDAAGLSWALAAFCHSFGTRLGRLNIVGSITEAQIAKEAARKAKCR